MLARNPATANHLSYQLAQYFVADNPPPALVGRMTQRYLWRAMAISATCSGLHVRRNSNSGTAAITARSSRLPTSTLSRRCARPACRCSMCVHSPEIVMGLLGMLSLWVPDSRRLQEHAGGVA